MKQNKLINTFREIGLTENESVLYSSSLSLGPSTILELAKETQLPRTTVYGLVEKLKQQGLMYIEVKGLKKLYTSESPEKLKFLLKRRQETLDKELPELSALYNMKSGASLIKYYEGLESVKNVYEELLKDIKSGDEYLVLSDQAMWQKLDEPYFKKFLERRGRLPIKIKMLLQNSTIAQEMLKFQKNYNSEVRILPEGTTLSTNLIVTPQRVVIHQLVTPIFAIVIENPSIIKMHQESFNIMWQSRK
jgi:sugar-specific transcriptional regulator TrmB